MRGSSPKGQSLLVEAPLQRLRKRVDIEAARLIELRHIVKARCSRLATQARVVYAVPNIEHK